MLRSILPAEVRPLVIGIGGAVLGLAIAAGVALGGENPVHPGAVLSVSMACRTADAALDLGVVIDRKDDEATVAIARALVLSGDCFVLPPRLRIARDGRLVKIVASKGGTDVWQIKVETYAFYVPVDREDTDG